MDVWHASEYVSELASKCKLRKFVSFHLHTKPVFGRVLVHSVDKIDVLVVTVELIWLLFLNILSFNFVQTPNKSLRFRRFRRSYVNHPVVFQQLPKLLYFLAWCALFKLAMFLFWSPNDVSSQLTELFDLFPMVFSQ